MADRAAGGDLGRTTPGSSPGGSANIRGSQRSSQGGSYEDEVTVIEGSGKQPSPPRSSTSGGDRVMRVSMNLEDENSTQTHQLNRQQGGNWLSHQGSKYESPKSPGIPWIRGRNGRFCPFCGRAISNFFNRERCPHRFCSRPLPHPQPGPRIPQIWCDSCKVVRMRADQRFCIMCRWITPVGKAWQKIVQEGKMEIHQAQVRMNASIRRFETSFLSMTSGGNQEATLTGGNLQVQTPAGNHRSSSSNDMRATPEATVTSNQVNELDPMDEDVEELLQEADNLMKQYNLLQGGIQQQISAASTVTLEATNTSGDDQQMDSSLASDFNANTNLYQ